MPPLWRSLCNTLIPKNSIIQTLLEKRFSEKAVASGLHSHYAHSRTSPPKRSKKRSPVQRAKISPAPNEHIVT